MPVRPSLDYTSKDFDAIRARLFNVISSAFPKWTDFQVADFGNTLVELMAFVGDVLTFYQDNQANESRWSTARLRRSLLSMAKFLPYAPKGASAATVDLNVQLAASPAGSVAILVGDTFQTLDLADPIVFQVIEAVVIAAQSDPPAAVVTVEHSVSQQDVFQSTSLPNQLYTLAELPFLDGTLRIVATDGEYAVVDDFLNSRAVDRHATVSVDENDRAKVRFGDGLAGSIPAGAITFSYKTGGGSRGNVIAGAIRKVNRAYTDSLGNPVRLTVENLEKAGGGYERQTVEAIRAEGPRSLRTLTRCVSREDYETAARTVLGVERALHMTADEKPGVLENHGELYLVPAGGGAASDALIASVREAITVTYPKSATFNVNLRTARYRAVNVTTRIHLAAGALPAVVGPAIRIALAIFFSTRNADGSPNELIDFGYRLDGALAWSDIFNVVRDTRGVRKIDDDLAALTLNDESKDIELAPEEFPILGTVTVIDAATGAVLP